MSDSVNYEKLAEVFNRASAQGKTGFCQMLWLNQPDAVRSHLLQFLHPQTQAIINTPMA